MTTNSPRDTAMTGNQTPPSIPTEEPKYGGFTRFEIELEVGFQIITGGVCREVCAAMGRSSWPSFPEQNLS